MALPPQPADAHLTVQPRLFEQGKVTDVLVELPRLRPGPPPVRLKLEAVGIEVISSRLREVVGSETRWDVRARTDAPPGNVALVLRAGFADGETVEVGDTLTVVPPETTGSFPWIAAVAGAALAVGLAIAAFVLVRRNGRA
ncbi:MAG: hypothetical protein ACXWZY_06765 [Gaiellaceae bacterium]